MMCDAERRAGVRPSECPHHPAHLFRWCYHDGDYVAAGRLKGAA